MNNPLMDKPILKNTIRLLAVLAILLLVMPLFVFTVNERQMAVVLRFGKPVREFVEPGICYRIPFVESVRLLPKTNQFWGDDRQFELPDLPTRDDKKIELIPWAIWRISEPTVFAQRMRTNENAEQRVSQIARSAIRDVLTKYDLAEIIRSTDRDIPSSSDYSDEVAIIPDLEGALGTNGEAAAAPPARIKVGRTKILQIIKEEAQRRLARQSDEEGDVGRGIELVDIGISQVDFVETVRLKTFDRWIAERESISARNTNEGERLKAKIVNEAKAEVARIEGEGQQLANQIKGDADALAIRRYAEVINEVGDFYNFVRTLEAYEKAIGKDTRMIFSTNSEFFRMLNEVAPQEGSLPELPADSTDAESTNAETTITATEPTGT